MHAKSKKTGRDVDWGALGGIRDEHEFVQLVIEDLVCCQSKAVGIAQKMHLDVGQIDLYVFDGHYPHQLNLERRCSFLHQILDLSVSFFVCSHACICCASRSIHVHVWLQVLQYACMYVCILSPAHLP
jgi:hypothetical protein